MLPNTTLEEEKIAFYISLWTDSYFLFVVCGIVLLL